MSNSTQSIYPESLTVTTAFQLPPLVNVIKKTALRLTPEMDKSEFMFRRNLQRPPTAVLPLRSNLGLYPRLAYPTLSESASAAYTIVRFAEA